MAEFNSVPNPNYKITLIFYVVIICGFVFLFTHFDPICSILSLAVMYLALRIVSRLKKENKESERHLIRAIFYFGLFFFSIRSVYFDEVNMTNNTTALTKISSSLAGIVVLFAAAIAFIECIDSAIEYYDIKIEESPLLVRDFCWNSLFLFVNSFPLLLILLYASHFDVLTGSGRILVFLLIIPLLSYLLVLLG